MKINIASTNRFHLLDLARELSKHGHDVKFYSYVPTKRCIKYGLNKKNCTSLLWIALPFFILDKILPCHNFIIKIRNLFLDYYMSFFSRKCDIYICLGTVYKKSIISSKKRFKAVTILEWGSKHIYEQQEILASINAKTNKEYFNKRSLEGYKLADYISIPSDHVRLSFIKRGIPQSKLLQNPYGVDISMFHPTTLDENINYDILMVGGWSLRKGCDLLTELCRKYKYTLLHVGGIVDIEFPTETNMTHVPPVDQKKLINYYSKAKIFVIPSREEGLAMVQAQAIACGLPIVCSKNTGGRDLRNFLDDPKWIIEMKDTTLEELNKCVQEALILSSTQKEKRNYANKAINCFTWRAYGNRYNKIIESIKYE